jgi:rod shape-determining protein MreC
MEFLLNRFRNFSVLVIVVLAQLVLLAYQVKSNQDMRLIRVWSVTAVTPVAKVLEAVRRNTIGVVEDYFVLINVREENLRLIEQLGKLKMENHFLKSELQTADRAEALKAFQARTPSRTVPARVIGTGTGANSRVVYVDQGSSAGIMRGMAVVTPDGIVGKVLDAYPTASQVLLITDGGFAAGVISQKNRVHGTIKGQGQSKCYVDFVQNEEKVEVGEMFYTSGDDRIFPKGMPVGRATVVREGKTFKEIFVVPNGMQNGLEEVLIVVQGEHQPIPDLAERVVSGNIYVGDAPTGAAPKTAVPGVLMTDADRLRTRYQEVGRAQGHTFGEGAPGSKPPNFNLRVEEAAPAATPPPAKPRPANAPVAVQPAPVAPAAKARPMNPSAASGIDVVPQRQPVVPASQSRSTPDQEPPAMRQVDRRPPGPQQPNP